MNIKSIKQRAQDLLPGSQQKLRRIFLILMLLELVKNIFPSEGNIFVKLMSIAVGIIFISVSHGYIVSSLKVVRHNEIALKDEDGWVGLTRFNELFSTYFLSALIVYAIGIILALLFIIISVIFFGTVFGGILPGLSGSMNLTNAILSSATNLFSIFVLYVLLVIIVIAVVVFIIQAYLFAAPYLLERYQMYGWTAIKESFGFIKGHVLDLIKLQLSYFGWFILQAFIVGMLSSLLQFIPIVGNLIAIGAGALFAIYVFLPKYQLSLAIFFEEIAYYRYDHVKEESYE